MLVSFAAIPKQRLIEEKTLHLDFSAAQQVHRWRPRRLPLP
jgi:hypothetical protein